MPKTHSKVFSTRLPADIFSGIDEVARERRRKRGDVVRQALVLYLENWADYHIAMDRLYNPHDPVLSEREFFDEFGWDA